MLIYGLLKPGGEHIKTNFSVDRKKEKNGYNDEKNGVKATYV